jgi:uncharacterized protein DUF6088
MRGVAKEILEFSAKVPEGTVLSARGLLHLGGRAAVDQALSRLARESHLLRVSRGRYVRPVETRFGARAPSPEKVIESLAEANGEIVVPSGAVAANELGLTTQMPVRRVFLTSGRSRRLRVGKQAVELRHAPPWQLRNQGRPSGRALRALAWLGPNHAHAAAKRLKVTLPKSEQKELLAARAGLPTWLAKTVSETFAAGAG